MTQSASISNTSLDTTVIRSNVYLCNFVLFHNALRVRQNATASHAILIRNISFGNNVQKSYWHERAYYELWFLESFAKAYPQFLMRIQVITERLTRYLLCLCICVCLKIKGYQNVMVLGISHFNTFLKTLLVKP